MAQQDRARLERSCASPGWIRSAPSQTGFERIEAWFAGHAYDPHRHDCYALGYTISGTQRFRCGGTSCCSRPGHAIVITPDRVHDGRAGCEAGFRYRMLYLDPCLVSDALGSGSGVLGVGGDAVTRDDRLLRALRGALGDLTRTLEGLAQVDVVLAIARALHTLVPARPVRAERRCPWAVTVARAYLSEHCATLVTSEDLERETGLDRYALARQFRIQLGTSPHRYLVMRRLDRARAGIRGGLTLAETAVSSGFSDQSHFTRQFRRAYGLSPGRWRDLQARDGR